MQELRRIKLGEADDLDMSPGQLPVELSYQTPWHLVIFFSLFGTMWTLIPSGLVWAFLAEGGSLLDPKLFARSGFLIVGLGILAGCVHVATSARVIRYYSGYAEIWRKNLLGTRMRKLFYAEYDGVLLHEQMVHRKNKADLHWQKVTLKHKDRLLDLPLVRRNHAPEPRNAWKEWARALHLPALQQDGDGFLALQVVEVDQPLQKRASDESADWAATTPPRGLQVWQEQGNEGEEELVVRVTADRMGWAVRTIMLAVPTAFVVTPFFVKHVFVLFPIVGALMLMLMAALIMADVRDKRLLRISRQRIVLTDKHPQGRHRGAVQELAVQDVESVLLHGNHAVNRSVQVRGKDGVLDIGPGLSAQANHWLQDFLRASVITA